MIIVTATVVGVALNFMHVDPVRALFLTAVVNGMIAPPLLILIVLLGSDRTVMQDKVSGRLSRTPTWIAAACMSAAAIALVMTSVHF